MEATPDTYRADIARTKEDIANLERSPMTQTDEILHSALRRQLAALEQGLARAERAWAHYQAQQKDVTIAEGQN